MLEISKFKSAINLLILCCCTWSLNAQTQQSYSDTLHAQLHRDSSHIFRYRKVRPLVSYDQRNSFIHDAPVNLVGVQAGVLLHERHSLGIGLYNITAKSSYAKTTLNDTKVSYNRTLSLNYLTIFYEYAFIDRRWWTVGIPVEIGLGNFKIDYKNTQTGASAKGYPYKGGIIPFGLGLDITFNVLPWLGLNGMGGYRWVADKNPKLNFNGAFYSFGVQVAVGELYRKMKFHFMKKKAKKKIAHYHIL